MFRLFLPLFIVFLIAGCSGEPSFTDHSQDQDRYAKDVKQLAINAIEQANKSREPGDCLLPLVTELADQVELNRPVGSHKPTYDEMLALAKPLAEECNNGKPANLAARLGQLKKLAEKLPGEVQMDGD